MLPLFNHLIEVCDRDNVTTGWLLFEAIAHPDVAIFYQINQLNETSCEFIIWLSFLVVHLLKRNLLRRFMIAKVTRSTPEDVVVTQIKIIALVSK